jgi:hypothetical protein
MTLFMAQGVTAEESFGPDHPTRADQSATLLDRARVTPHRAVEPSWDSRARLQFIAGYLKIVPVWPVMPGDLKFPPPDSSLLSPRKRPGRSDSYMEVVLTFFVLCPDIGCGSHDGCSDHRSCCASNKL